MEQPPFVGLVLWTTDIPALRRFLVDVCGLETVEEFPGFAKLHAWNAVIELHSDDDADRRHPWFQALARDGVARGIGAELRIRVEDVDASVRAAQALGGLVIQHPSPLAESYLATVMGPDGYLISVWH